MSSSTNNMKGKDIADNEEGTATHQIIRQSTAPLSRYESQKRRDWNTFSQYLKNLRPPVSIMTQCTPNHVLDFLRYLDQFGKTKVHNHGCVFYGQPDPPAPCTCSVKQAWGSLDALIGRLRAAYEENGGPPETNPFASGVIRVYLREVRDSQAKARGVPYKKKKKRRNNQLKGATSSNNNTNTDTSTSSITNTSDFSFQSST
ncbi:hypothetical protein RND81_09G011300 [Saponaria officinalis]|uniref:ALOG domain-containing protein n=1 Tax=Saponaria officinalis TaxID=3572 RepID=A0AAW1IHF8_SAPOF